MEFGRCLSCNAACCSKAGAVLLTKEDIVNIAKFFNISNLDAKRKYTHKFYDGVDGFIRYINKFNKNDEYSDCIFKGNVIVGNNSFLGCTIYKNRPEICKEYSESNCEWV